MSQITVRGIDPEIEEKIRKMARDSRQSINNVLVGIIRQKFQNKKHSPPAETLKQLAGGWSREDALTFLNSINSCEQIDREMWQ
ncbi:MAG: hypothetical protein ABIJ52_05990 [Pseudomonadota bacterium]